MASRTIATILNLRDNMSGGLLRTSRNVSNLSAEMRRANRNAISFSNNMKKQFEKMGDKTIKTSVAMAGAVGALATTAGFKEAFGMEGYKVQLETAVKDTKKAGILMSNAVKFANKTPFETGEVVQATAKMEMYGLSSKRWLSDVADMAGSTNKSIDQATEAMADVAVGEFERIKEFGIKKDMILAESNKKYGEGVVFNARGQVLDQAKLLDTVQEMMQKKYKGGAEKLAATTKGLWSTITGVTKSSLAKIVGMQENGTIKAGSLLETVKNKIKSVADQIQKWQQDGSVDNMAAKVTVIFNKIFNISKKLFGFIAKHKDTIINVALAFASFYVAIKVIKLMGLAITGVQIAMSLLSGTMALTPFGWLAIGITALIMGFTLAYRNSETFRKLVAKLWEGIKAFGGYIINNFIPAIVSLAVAIVTYFIASFQNMINTVSGIIKALIRIISGIIEFVVGVFTLDWKKAWDGITNIFGGVGDGIKAVFDGVKDYIIAKIKLLTDSIKSVLKALGLAKEDVDKFEKSNGKGKSLIAQSKEKGFTMQKYALGGIANKPSIFGEAGPEIAIPLNKTARSQSLLSQANKFIGDNKQAPKMQIINSQPAKAEKTEMTFNFYAPIYGVNDLKNQMMKIMYEVMTVKKANLA